MNDAEFPDLVSALSAVATYGAVHQRATELRVTQQQHDALVASFSQLSYSIYDDGRLITAFGCPIRIVDDPTEATVLEVLDPFEEIAVRPGLAELDKRMDGNSGWPGGPESRL